MTNTTIQEEYNANGRLYQLKLFSDMDVMIAEEGPVQLLDAVLEGLDYNELYRAYSRQGRKPTPPRWRCSR